MNLQPRHLALAVVAVLVAWPHSVVDACVGCRQTSEEVARVEPATVMAGFAFSWSVLFMLVIVATLLMFMITYMRKVMRDIDARFPPPPRQ